MRLVLVGLSVAIALQKDNVPFVPLILEQSIYSYYIVIASYIYLPRKFRLSVWLVRQFYDHERSPGLPANDKIEK